MCTGSATLHELQSRKKEMKRAKTAGIAVQCLLELKQLCLPFSLPPMFQQLSLPPLPTLMQPTAPSLSLTDGNDVRGPGVVQQGLPQAQVPQTGLTQVTLPREVPTSSSDLGLTASSSSHGRLLYIPMDGIAFDTEGVCLTGRMQIHWMSQLLQMPKGFVLHTDGKHKLHHGEWILMSVGTHYLRWDEHHRTLSTSFAPLVYIMCKQHETIGSARMLLQALIAIVDKYFPGQALAPGAVMSDHSDAFRTAYQEAFPSAKFGQCYPHIVRKWTEGVYASKKWVHFNEVTEHVRTVHMSGSADMQVMLTDAIGKEWDAWRATPESKMTTFWNSYFTGGWDCWSLHQFECRLATPSQQTQESWHKQLLQSRIPGMFRGSTAFVFEESLPQLIEMDAIMIPTVLPFSVPAIPKALLEKAIWYIDHQKTHVVSFHLPDGSVGYYFLRKDNPAELSKLTKTIIKVYEMALRGEQHKELKDLEDLMNFCTSFHIVWEAVDESEVCECEGNPSNLRCSCKGFRGHGICSHVLTVNHMLLTFNVRYELRTIGKKAAKRSGGNVKKVPPALTHAPAMEKDSSDEEDEHLLALGQQGL